MADSVKFIDSYTASLTGGAVILPKDKIIEAAELIKSVNEEGGITYIVGNGGSAATAQHFAQALHDINIKAVSLVDNISTISAIANDTEYRYIFSLQLMRLLSNKDILVAISCSGDSGNIIRAVEVAREYAIPIVALLGFDGGHIYKMLNEGDIPIVVYNSITDKKGKIRLMSFGVTEDLHLSICHMIAGIINE